ncbi:PLP-dependent aminotransferase family protein [Roseivivax sp. GX 12232]|uniref:aminotransferase-like domain-containing protein n=1 Tax=Roseivivax sp. GX 12232 TaxID=2900547 RepID=UPI001E558CB1|nr:PLP-dependent aminotransferase family protein [Roseivivax sp. GX 12232]MCE0504536.1 PLP-dependent aminotransferase family protein [Roseivivax sp. GX 12232]
MDTILSAYAEGAADLPKYRRLADAIRGAIAAGQLAAGDKLPPVRDLAFDLGITPGTVARAYTILTDGGAARAEVGRGTFVAGGEAGGMRKLLPDAPWPQTEAPQSGRFVSFVAPKLPDCGQIALIREGFARLSRHPFESLINYPSRAAFKPAREAVLDWLSDTPLGPVSEEDLTLCHGGQNGIGIVMQTVLRGARPVVLVEELSYPGFRRAAELLRAEVVSVPMDEDGILPEALDELARRHDAQLLCTSPEIHNPTGRQTPDRRRKEIAAVAQRRGFHVLEDDCYRLGPRAGLGYRALLPEQGWLVASISKSITPALRVGFVVAPQARRADLRRSVEHGFFGLAQPLGDLVADLLRRPELPAILDEVRREYDRYIRAAVNLLGGHDVGWREGVPFLWLRLPAGWRAATFVQAAEFEGVQLRAADEFALRDGFAPHAVRIAINAQVGLPAFEAALGRVRGLLENPPERIAV